MHRVISIFALVLFACSPEETLSLSQSAEGVADEPHTNRTDSRFDEAFRSAGDRFGVPPALLKAYAYTQTRYEMLQGTQEFEGVPSRSGVMALTTEDAKAASALTGRTAEAILSDPAANIEAAAALLDAHGRALGVAGLGLGAWAPALAELAGLESKTARRLFIEDGVFRALEAGVGALSDALEESGQSLSLDGEFAAERSVLPRGPDYPDALWIPTDKYNERPLGVSHVIIHTCEGSYYGCVDTLTNPDIIASAHYVVNEDGSEVAQLVREYARAWHVAAYYDCNLNSGVDCGLQGWAVNDFSIGIEHGGYASQTSFSKGQIETSARLLCDITRDHGIPRDRYHVVAHGQLQPYDRTDPGKNWPWSRYLELARQYCGDNPPPPPCTVKGGILKKYQALGGANGALGKCVTSELPTADGRGRYNHFQRGSIYWKPQLGAYAVLGGIRDKWQEWGWERGALGYPVIDERRAPDGIGRFSHFERGSIYWKPNHGAFVVRGGIRDKWAELRSERGPLGYPTRDEGPTADGKGRYSHFEKGSIYWRPNHGAFAVQGGIRNKWRDWGWERGALGYPTTDENRTPDGIGRYSHFERGSIYWKPNHGAFVVKGGIRNKWAKLGWERSPLGYPTTDERATADGKGRYSHFEKGSIYWKGGAREAYAVQGSIRGKWAKLGWERGALGYPTTDERSTPNGLGRYSHFEKGSIYWRNGASEAFMVRGAIRGKWAKLGWEQGALGFPTTDERDTPNGKGRYSHFENGSIYWRAGSAEGFMVKGAIRSRWAKLGWENSTLGFPMTDERPTEDGEGRYNDFEGGSIVWHPSTGAHVLTGRVLAFWTQLGGTSSCLGYPTGEQSRSESGNLEVPFQGGSIVIDAEQSVTATCDTPPENLPVTQAGPMSQE